MKRLCVHHGNYCEIHVSDNGLGIPDNIKDKIFQPFFTTKPTGQGTGLGLSLAYDIVKTHGGKIEVESKGGEGTKFIIELPIVLNHVFMRFKGLSGLMEHSMERLVS